MQMLLRELMNELERRYGVEVWFVEDDNGNFELDISKGNTVYSPVWLEIYDAKGYPDETLLSDDYLDAHADDISYHTKAGTYVYHGLPDDLSELIVRH